MKTKEILIILRKNKGLSQQELADMLKVDRTTIGKWETGVSRPIRYINQLCQIYNVSADYILGNETSESKENQELLSKFNKLTEEGQIEYLKLMDMLLANPKYKK